MAKQRRVAVTVELEWPYKRHHEVFAGIQHYARQRGNWECIPDLYAGPSLDAKRSKPPYDGIIARVTPTLFEWTRQAGIPLVNVWFNSWVTDVPVVAPDFAASGRMAAEHLIARGFRQFGFAGYHRQRVSKEQLAGFRAALDAAGFSCSSLLVSSSYSASAKKWHKFNARLDDWIDGWSPPIGVYASTDLLCRYLACACTRREVRVPHDAALIGAHNEPVICAHPEPALTSIELGYERVGFRAAELLDAMMDGAPPPTEPVYLEPVELLPRQSTDALAVDDPLVAEALRFIAEHSHEQIRVDDVAAGILAERRTLERRFRALLDRSVAREIARLRVERLKRRLAESDTPIKHLASESGFHDMTQMCAAFRRIEGISPSAFRRSRQT
ncbi:MAG: substrate-binding domain-containing protein [Candidatus Nealsonbacteria bacterium]|nr:substrate-binding domain-containing protein [Candidatus Nealsonbacteria bacterium]